jgi:hypothetical protein
MGCEVQVHEKTNKRGTWAYHCALRVGTSTRHLNTTKCIIFQIKQTKKERLTDTIHFKHKSITNPTMSPANKLMHAIANLQATISDKVKHSPNQQLQELQKIVTNITADNLPKSAPAPAKSTQVSRVPDEPTVPRVQGESPVLRVHTAQSPVITT